MNSKLTPNDLAKIFLDSYYESSDVWDFDASVPLNAGDGLCTFLVSEITECAGPAGSTMLQLAAAVHAVERTLADVEYTQHKLLLYASRALAAQYVEWFIASGKKYKEFQTLIATWRSVCIDDTIDTAFGHAVPTLIDSLVATLGVENNEVTDEMPKLVLARLRELLTITEAGLPLGESAEPLYASSQPKTAEGHGNGPRPPEGQTVGVQSVT